MTSFLSSPLRVSPLRGDSAFGRCGDVPLAGQFLLLLRHVARRKRSNQEKATARVALWVLTLRSSTNCAQQKMGNERNSLRSDNVYF